MKERLMTSLDGNDRIYKKIDTCRVCGTQNLIQILNLGNHPLANSLRKNKYEIETKIPLKLVLCRDCNIAQLEHTVEPKAMFSNYLWVTGTSNSTLEHAENFYNYSKKILGDIPKKVLEIASNDGTFLKPFKYNGAIVFGIDPAENIAKIANENDLTTYIDFFSNNTYDKYKDKIGKVNFVFARNVLAHVPKPMEFIKGIEKFMDDCTIGAVEFHYNKIIIDELHYDSIYHEHYFYYSIKNIKYMLSKQNLFIFDAIESPINKGNVTVYFSKKNRKYSNNLNNLLNDENKKNILEKWEAFAIASIKHKNDFKKCITKYENIIGFGSSARSSTLLNFSEINNKKIKIIVDNNDLKHERYTAGSNIKITKPQDLQWEKEKVILVLAWNFFEEIKSYLIKNRFKGTLIKPFPQIEEHNL